MTKKILGLDLGTNSIGWALIEKKVDDSNGQILAAGSRILPMSQDILGKFDSGVSISQTAERTGFRGIRRLREDICYAENVYTGYLIFLVSFLLIMLPKLILKNV
jgi:CRISPR/Cas system Type II protein with McrA/HNH and RuvC-like nuclease domain